MTMNLTVDQQKTVNAVRVRDLEDQFARAVESGDSEAAQAVWADLVQARLT